MASVRRVRIRREPGSRIGSGDGGGGGRGWGGAGEKVKDRGKMARSSIPHPPPHPSENIVRARRRRDSSHPPSSSSCSSSVKGESAAKMLSLTTTTTTRTTTRTHKRVTVIDEGVASIMSGIGMTLAPPSASPPSAPSSHVPLASCSLVSSTTTNSTPPPPPPTAASSTAKRDHPCRTKRARPATFAGSDALPQPPVKKKKGVARSSSSSTVSLTLPLSIVQHSSPPPPPHPAPVPVVDAITESSSTSLPAAAIVCTAAPPPVVSIKAPQIEAANVVKNTPDILDRWCLSIAAPPTAPTTPTAPSSSQSSLSSSLSLSSTSSSSNSISTITQRRHGDKEPNQTVGKIHSRTANLSFRLEKALSRRAGGGNDAQTVPPAVFDTDASCQVDEEEEKWGEGGAAAAAVAEDEEEKESIADVAEFMRWQILLAMSLQCQRNGSGGDSRKSALPGPFPISMSRRHLHTLVNGEEEYWLCEKSDGERAMLWIATAEMDRQCGNRPIPSDPDAFSSSSFSGDESNANAKTKEGAGPRARPRAYLVDRRFRFRELPWSSRICESIASRGPSLLDGELVTTLAASSSSFSSYSPIGHHLVLFDTISLNGLKCLGMRHSARRGQIDKAITHLAAASAAAASSGSGGGGDVPLLFPLPKPKKFVKPCDIAYLFGKIQEDEAKKKKIYNGGIKHGCNRNDGLIFTPENDSYFCRRLPLLKWKERHLIDFKIKEPFWNPDRPSELFFFALDSTGSSPRDIRVRSAPIFPNDLSRVERLISEANKTGQVLKHRRKEEEEMGGKERSLVVECEFLPSQGCWTIIGNRPDKTDGNHINTVIATLENIAEDISSGDLIAAWPQKTSCFSSSLSVSTGTAGASLSHSHFPHPPHHHPLPPPSPSP